MNKYILLAFILAGALFSCTEGALITPGDEFLIPSEPGTFEVKMDGALKDFSYSSEAVSGAGGSYIAGMSETGSTIVISGPVELSKGGFSQNQGYTIAIVTSDGMFSNIGETGLLAFSLSVMEVDFANMTITGKFSGSVYNAFSGEEAVLTDGVFYKVPFEQSDSANRTLTAYFNDQLLDFSENAMAQGQTTSAVITGFNADQIQTLTISVPGGIAEDEIFTEEDGVTITISLDASPNPNDSYTNYDPATETYLPFTLAISSVTPGEDGRVVGTFSGQVSKFVGGQPTEQIEITNGIIDVPVE